MKYKILGFISCVYFLSGCSTSIHLSVNPYDGLKGSLAGKPYLIARGLDRSSCGEQAFFSEYTVCLFEGEAPDNLNIKYMKMFEIGGFGADSGYVNGDSPDVLDKKLKSAKEKEIEQLRAARLQLSKIPEQQWGVFSINIDEIRASYRWRMPSGMPSLINWTKNLEVILTLDDKGQLIAKKIYTWDEPMFRGYNHNPWK